VTPFGPVAFDSVTADLVHRRDVDDWEDGILTSVDLRFSAAGGCRLDVSAQGCLDESNRMVIRSVRWDADAACPGLGQDKEGIYISQPGGIMGTVTLSAGAVPQSDAVVGCFDGTVEVALSGEPLLSAAGEATLTTSALVAEGHFLSAGDRYAKIDCGAVIGEDSTGEDADSPSPDIEEVLPDVPVGPPVKVNLTIACPKCSPDAAVRLQASAGWELGQPQMLKVFQPPLTFPIQELLEKMVDTQGKTVGFPEGAVTFRCFQDTLWGGSMAPETGEPVSPLVTIPDLAAGQISEVELLMDPDVEPPVECTPGQTVCLSFKARQECALSGTEWTTVNCEEGSACAETSGKCEPVVCSPSATACIDTSHHATCLPSGTGWGESIECSAGHFCINGACMKEECMAEVVFVVDTSSSMSLHWDAVSSSIQKFVAMSPMASFGMLQFPEYGPTGCKAPSTAVVPLDSSQAAAFSKWFLEHNPFGKTPLVDAMEALPGLLPSLFTSGKGTVILLSDGADTCAYEMMADLEEREALILADLEAATKALFEEKGIKTYVVAYNYQGNPEELVAIAKNGGTGKITYTPAGNEQELMSALVGIAQDLKLCFE